MHFRFFTYLKCIIQTVHSHPLSFVALKSTHVLFPGIEDRFLSSTCFPSAVHTTDHSSPWTLALTETACLVTHLPITIYSFIFCLSKFFQYNLYKRTIYITHKSPDIRCGIFSAWAKTVMSTAQDDLYQL